MSDRACSEGACSTGYVCNPLTTRCALPNATSPDSVTTGTACDGVGSFIPCAGTSCTGSGCRTCAADNTWGGCQCLPDDATCDCSVNACNGCTPTNGGTEACDGLDNDCNGIVDDAPENTLGCTSFYPDNDRDGYGAGIAVCYCVAPDGYVDNNQDPDDTNANVRPDASELCDGLDNNGDSVIPVTEVDDDGDGYVECSPWVGASSMKGGDCNDNDAAVYPNAPELCDGVANACTTLPADESDPDNDKYVACSGWNDRTGSFTSILGGDDCDNNDATVYPSAYEILDGKDNDCDSKIDECVADCDCGAGLVACYPLDTRPPDDQGPNDVAGMIDPTDKDPVVSDCKIGSCYDFAPADAYKTGAAVDTLAVDGDVTVSAWVRANSLDGSSMTRHYIFEVSNSHVLELRGDGSIRCQAHRVSSYTAANAIADNAWHHIGCSYTGSANKGNTRILLDGDVVVNDAINGGAPQTNGWFCIGSNSSGSDCQTDGYFFDGRIDHIQIFDSKLANAQICGAAGRTGCYSE